jgi:hypothetical protein
MKWFDVIAGFEALSKGKVHQNASVAQRRILNTKINSKDFRVQHGKNVKPKEWPMRVKSFP